ncbi:MAG: glycine/sarcosine/betaine reductase selenoprotein B family protein [Alphaproteobacteria bacterium]|jgi:D-proline reductase (dithiol) PrdB|nr:glycine/sarcosine/betaine reductase selenoprotein B family protein [Alphaproteobacteria bacterium]MDP6566967.1 glycine/sarcosine/betaine reductase selenoprotein B family protein [Alphaproteobacteria bacterium]MDP6816026.1 glycine/sarcosine/betaine reductase selenoprotein B family protein [Alphaproteobacteria bacterium]
MEPIDYVDKIDKAYQSQGYPPYRWSVNEEAPLTPLAKPLADCTVSMLTSGGISYTEAEPFNPIAKDDFRLDEIDPGYDENGFQIHDAYYDYRDGEKDINVIFPIVRLRELAADGVIGRVAERLWSGFMGRIYKRTHTLEEAAPRFADELQRDGVDAIVMVPA